MNGAVRACRSRLCHKKGQFPFVQRFPRDFHDIYALLRSHGDGIDYDEVEAALKATAAKRGSSAAVPEYRSVLESVRGSEQMASVWESYVRSAPYAAGISFYEVVDTAVGLGDRAIGREAD
ncbi:nucleotidyl transferase AbiEii/AbiGii toxin family protein [Olsenella sp. Marseille-P4559]|uniref:nucleotidyl transferase AbiEii/AbiGii toxin family protein n=1 Tax=Olsenella sp. Marseille-P4559 TaxID=2364795 RepID=UPI00102FD304|nr:nucleotidyl transferase AbiEii/AbiGii toxin family protein [Olsenella sp. Marseille-P4559]